MEIGLSEFVKLSRLQATLAVLFGRLRVPARYEAPPEIADRVEPSIDAAAGAPASGAAARDHAEALAVPGERRTPYVAEPFRPSPPTGAERGSPGADLACAGGLLTTPRARINRR